MSPSWKGLGRAIRFASIVTLLSGWFGAGCSSGPRRLPADGGGFDAGSVDASVTDGDAATLDASPDANATDAGAFDGSTEIDAGDSDGGVGGDGGTGGPLCDPGIACGAADACDPGLVCITNACGTKVCQSRGADCGDDTECAVGSACVTTTSGSFCTPSNGEVCNASTDCPQLHSCDGSAGSRVCTLRRIPCTDEAQCPISYVCAATSGDSLACQYVYRPCSAVGTCGFGVCSDVDGNTTTECGGGGVCEQNTDCTTPGDRCVVSAFIVACGLGGLCNQSGAPCAAGYECLDLRGDGYGECVPTGGSCNSQTDCGAGEICAVPQDRSPPTCLAPM